MSKEKVMPAGLPFLAAGGVWFIAALILPVYKLGALLACAVGAAAVYVLLTAVRRSQIAKLPPAPTVKVRAEELAKKLDVCRDKLLAQESRLSDPQVRRHVKSMATTLDLIADEVEKDPKDRNKVRKLANHYGDMITGLIDKYILLETQEGAAAEGGNVTAALAKLREGLASADEALKKVLDDLFSDDAMEVSADINVLEQLLKTEGAENKMDFSSLDQ
ncbi:MAG: 5-bromo-4-chloroindolyl phosphate hydrolysis family protein [Firmicutes bacterium]|nr:5-bromo-4-chloroindolyl phosphate hydrolysis family protein [Bacillota bacterium]